MKTMAALILALSIVTGCASFQSYRPIDRSSLDASSSPNPTSTVSAAPVAAPVAPAGPGLVIPATGGAPIMAIHLGGAVYQPLTGGAPVVGIPVGPH